jgi:hypothetical protein
LDGGKVDAAVLESLASLSLAKPCPFSAEAVSTVNCEQTNYRSYDGVCNNLEHPLWGAANTPFRRILPARYGDGE